VRELEDGVVYGDGAGPRRQEGAASTVVNAYRLPGTKEGLGGCRTQAASSKWVKKPGDGESNPHPPAEA
jgi:hypothetical protein